MSRQIVLIAALANNRVIGLDNRLPWHLPDDLKHFKAMTLDKTIVMGRKTWESLPGILPGRQHVVVSRNKNYRADGALVVNSIKEALQKVPEEEDVMIVGGAGLYEQCLAFATLLQLTLVDANIDGDAFFPQWDENHWREKQREHHAADEKHAYAFDFVTLERVA